MDRVHAAAIAVLLALAGALYFWGLGQLPFYTIGEPREALEVWEEIYTGEWILPMRNGEDLPSKPPLFHWLGGAIALVTGRVDELTSRLPSALLATATVLLVYWFGARRWGAVAGVYAACMLAANFEWIRAARSARVDMVLTTFLTGALIALDEVATAVRPGALALVLLYSCIGLATLAKGPLGIVLPGMVALAYLAWRHDLGRLWRMHLFLGGAFAISLPTCWYALAMWRGGGAFVHKQILVENLLTFFGWTSDPGTPQHSFAYVIPAFFAGFAPWSIFMLPLGASLLRNRRQLEDNRFVYPLVWFITVFLFFAIAAGKRTVYILPLYPAAALLLGVWWSRLDAGAPVLSPRAGWALRLAGWAVAAVVLVAGLAIASEVAGAQPLDLLRPWLHHTDQENLPMVRELIRSHSGVFVAWAVTAAVIASAFAWALQRSRWPIVFTALLVFVVSTTLVINGVIHPAIAQRQTFKPFLAFVRATVTEADQLAFYGGFDYGAVFYAGRRIPVVHGSLDDFRAAGQPRYLLLFHNDWRDLSGEQRQHLQVIRQSDGTGPDGKNPLLFARLKPPA